jgi:hypothetical protein
LVALLPGDADPAPGWREPLRVALVAAATRPEPLAPVAVARRECDRLQARLAAWGGGAVTGATVPWAGYLVG